MCTSITYFNQSGNFFGRTMDFGFQLDGHPLVIPRQYQWQPILAPMQTTRYGFVGTGRRLETYYVADGMNEAGLTVAELYFLHEAHYHDTPAEGKFNLAPQELIMWLLGEIKNIAELEVRLPEIHLVSREVALLGIVPPLHFSVTDATGRSVVLETNRGELEMKENPVGVMTNSPEFEWHLKNLNNYLSLRPVNFEHQTIGSHVIQPFGQGSGTYGLPGGHTSPERFVRAVYHRQHIDTGSTSDETINALFHLLNSVSIPKGVNIKDDGSMDYTQYLSVYDSQQKRYYFKPYHAQQVYDVFLTEALLTASEPTEFKVPTAFKSNSLI